jgi:hypothetical protein
MTSATLTSPDPLSFDLTGQTNITGQFTFSFTPSGAPVLQLGTSTIGVDTVTDPTTHQTYDIILNDSLNYTADSGSTSFSIDLPAGFYSQVTDDFVEFNITVEVCPTSGPTAEIVETIDLFIVGTKASPALPPPPPPKLTPEEKAELQSDADTLKQLANVVSDIGAATDPLHPAVKLAGSIAGQLAASIDPQVGTANSVVQAALSVAAGALEASPGLNPIGITCSTASAICGLAAKLCELLAADPPDGNFTTVYQAPSWTFGSIAGAGTAANTLITDSWQLFQDAANALMASERFQGAEYAGDTTSEALQNTAFNNALNAYNTQKQTVSTDLTTYFTQLQNSGTSDVNLSSDTSLASLQTYLKGLANPLTGDPFLADFIASINSTAPNLSGVINSDVQQALTALENSQAPALTGSAFTAISSAANQLTASGFPFTDNSELTEAVYIGYFGRAGDASGDSYWLSQLNNGNISVTGMTASFSVQPETTAAYPFLANEVLGALETVTSSNGWNASVPTNVYNFINSVYEDLFNRSVLADGNNSGLVYWSSQLTTNAGNPQAVANFILNVVSGASNTDQATIVDKVIVAEYFTQQFAASGLPWTSSGSSSSYALALSSIASVTSDVSTVIAAETTINNWLATQSATAGVALIGTAHVSTVANVG